jgi:ribosomal protein S18 acetylase RimI-like enzyme
MENIEIRKISLSDIIQLKSIGRQTFYETFANTNTESDMAKYLDENFSPEKLSDEITTPNSAFYFASVGNKVIGYLKVNSGSAQTELKDQNTFELERIYVLKEFQGKRVGQKLYETALNLAKIAKADFIWLGVWEKNHRALLFYEKNGFEEFDRHIFKLGDDLQTDIMMRLRLRE